jgi:hypothetical protein
MPDSSHKEINKPCEDDASIGVICWMEDLDNVELVVVLMDVGLIEHGIPNFVARLVHLVGIY